MADNERPHDPQAPGHTAKESDLATVLKQLMKINGVIISAFLAVFQFLAAIATLNAKILPEAIRFGLALVSLLLLVALIFIINHYARKSRKRQIKVSSLAALFVIIFAATAGTAYLIWHSHPGPAQDRSLTGTITSPGDGAGNVCQNEQLNASGTARNMQTGHRLWLFLYVASANNGAGLYYPGDHGPPDTDGRWAGGSVYIGGTGQPGQRLTLWLVDLGPQGYNDLGVNIPGPSPGFSSLQFAPDVTPLDSVTFTTMTCTPAPTAASSTPPSHGTQAVVFSDQFCSTAGGWTVGSGQTGGHYSTCAFRIYANANDIESSEPRVSTLYPVAPSGIEIDVTAHRIVGSAEGDEFGIACLANNEGYAFIVQADLAEIIKYSSTTGIIGTPLAEVPATVDMNAHDRLRATCTTDGAGAVHLTLWVNGQRIAGATDANNPIPTGTVGLFAATTSTTQTPTEAEFENFMVIRL